MSGEVSGSVSPYAYQGKLDSAQLVELGQNIATKKIPRGGSTGLKAKIANLATTLKTNVIRLTQKDEKYYTRIARNFISKENKALIQAHFSDGKGKLLAQGKLVQKNISNDLRLGNSDVQDLKDYAAIRSDLSKIDVKSEYGWFKQSIHKGLNLTKLIKPNFEDYQENPKKFANLVRLDKLSQSIDGEIFATALRNVGFMKDGADKVDLAEITPDQWRKLRFELVDLTINL